MALADRLKFVKFDDDYDCLVDIGRNSLTFTNGPKKKIENIIFLSVNPKVELVIQLFSDELNISVQDCMRQRGASSIFLLTGVDTSRFQLT